MARCMSPPLLSSPVRRCYVLRSSPWCQTSVRYIVCRPVATQSGRSATPGTSRFCVSVDILAVPDGENSDFLTCNLVDHTVVRILAIRHRKNVYGDAESRST